jgi:FkbM family methyltransferase
MIAGIRKLLNKTGYDVVRTRNQHNSLDEHINRVFAKYSIDCVIDVGANTGQYGIFLRELGFRGWIISFEPVASVFQELASVARKDNKWLCYNHALGEANDKREINVYKNTVFSSFLDTNSYSKKIWRSLDKASREVVEVKTLDHIIQGIKEKTLSQRFYLKLDTQGYDRSVLEGSIKSLQSVCALQLELSLIPIYENMVDPYHFLSELQDQNFLISGMYPINRDENLAVIEYDCVLVRAASSASG